jgi:hypothetical protein
VDEMSENSIPALNIDGIEAELGCSLYDYDMEMYADVLKSFVNNIMPPLDNLRNINIENINDYTIVLHSIKCSFAIIGAEKMRERALELEMKLKSGDLPGVLNLKDGFIKDAKTLVHDLNAWLFNLN